MVSLAYVWRRCCSIWMYISLIKKNPTSRCIFSSMSWNDVHEHLLECHNYPQFQKQTYWFEKTMPITNYLYHCLGYISLNKRYKFSETSPVLKKLHCVTCLSLSIRWNEITILDEFKIFYYTLTKIFIFIIQHPWTWKVF